MNTKKQTKVEISSRTITHEIKNKCDLLAKLKPQFDRARRENYKEALLMWEKHLDISFGIYGWNDEHTSIFSELYNDSVFAKEQEIYDANYLNIIPSNSTERAQYNLWYLTKYLESNLKYNIENKKSEILKTLDNSKNKEEFLNYLMHDCKEQVRISFVGDEPYNRKKLGYKVNSDKKEVSQVEGINKKIYLDKFLEDKEPEWGKATSNTVKVFCEANFLIQQERFLKEQLKEVGMQKTNNGAEGKQLKKVVWNGNQKELAELFIELQKKKWIGEIDMSGYDCNEIAENICNLFDLTKTKRGEGSNEYKSFYQILKGEPDKDEKTKRTYPQVYSPKYKKRFDNIKLRVNQSQFT